MSALPPATVRIKRKRTDEPVGFLRVQEGQGKRQRLDFVFSRDSTTTLPQDVRPTLPLPVRRFHMSRTTGSTLFMERRLKPSSTIDPSATPASEHSSESTSNGSTSPKPQKRPGRAARIPSPAAPITPIQTPPIKEVRLPSGLLMPWNVDSKELAAEMQAYTLQEIGRTIALDDAEDAARIPETRLKSPKSKFKPRKPALRYHERYPGEVLSVGDGMEFDEPILYEEDLDDDTEYIVDTYTRMPASSLTADENNFGLLVLSSEQEIELFYKETEDSDQENDEEEDENAEDHYTADYPDEEVDSDDEFGRDAYRYQNHNAADLEEFDEDDVWSDDEGESMRYPWKTKAPAWLKGPDDEDGVGLR